MNERHRMSLSQAAFVLLVFVIPFTAGTWWSEHQRSNDLAKVQHANQIASLADDWQLYDALTSFCGRVNKIRVRQNAVVKWINEHDRGFTLEPISIVVCNDVIHKPSQPRPQPKQGG